MNLVLLRDHELIDAERAVLGGGRARHLIEVLGVEPGRRLQVGREGQGIGEGLVTQVTDGLVELRFTLDRPPPPPPVLDLLLALPRPKVLRRILEQAPGLGLRRIVLVRSAHVDRSYFASPLLEPENIEAALSKGMEQAVELHRPALSIEPLFRPFVEDRLAGERVAGPAVVLHPSPRARAFDGLGGAPATLAIGPERGWTEFEVEMLEAAGFLRASLGPRILRVETAVVWAAARA